MQAVEGLPDFAELFEAEERHFWFRTRNEVLATVVRDVVRGLPQGYGVLEVGCGTGNVLRMLERNCTGGRVVGMDLHRQAVEFARRRVNCELVCADVHRWPFADPFDVVGLFDVLEHLEDDSAILTAIRDHIRPGGSLLLTVPAHQSLWSDVDVYAGHYRRYSMHQLKTLLRCVGLHVEYTTYFMTALWPAMWLSRSLPSMIRTKKTEDVNRHGRDLALSHLAVSPLANRVLGGLMEWERHVVHRRKALPFGTSLLAVARRPESAEKKLRVAA